MTFLCRPRGCTDFTFPDLNQVDNRPEEFSPSAIRRCTLDACLLAARRELPVVLLIDDDLVSREVTATLLTMSGYSVHTAETGAAALKMLADGKFQPGAILMDAQMPGLSGTELIAQLRACCESPIYAISGSEVQPELAAATDGFLLKPFDAEALHNLLDRRSAVADLKLFDPNEPVVNVEILASPASSCPNLPFGKSTQRWLPISLSVSKPRNRHCQGRHSIEVRCIGHAIKGGCGMAGARQAAHLGALLESIPVLSQDNHSITAPPCSTICASRPRLERMLDADLRLPDPSHLQTTWFGLHGGV